MKFSIILCSLAVTLMACGDSESSSSPSGSGASGAGAASGTGDPSGTGAGTSAGAGGSGGMNPSGSGGGVQLPDAVDVSFENNGATGTTRVNFAVPLTEGKLMDDALVRVATGGTEIARATRGLARYPDQSLRSVQVQVDVDPAAVSSVTVEIGAASTLAPLSLDDVASTLVTADGEAGPRVYALLPAEWLSGSGVAGPLIPEVDVAGTDLDGWTTHCDYDSFNTDTFIAEGADTTRAVWLYDRATAMYRGYARRGTVSPLASAYREASMFKNRITGTGTSARNGIPQGASEDPKYQYAQNLAIHYLLTGNDSFREAAEAMALGMTELWPSPGYAGGTDSWTERNAGFALLAYTWAAMVSDDQAGTLWAAADEAVDAYVTIQETYPLGYDDADARCFAHHGDAHDPDEAIPYFGCSPWMSSILADALDGYVRERTGATADAARGSLVKLGRIIARDGVDGTGNPLSWMGVGTDEALVDDYFEHIGESAYTVALAFAHDGKTDPELEQAAVALAVKFKNEGEVGQLRSFNWQCRAAVMTPTFLSP